MTVFQPRAPTALAVCCILALSWFLDACAEPVEEQAETSEAMEVPDETDSRAEFEAAFQEIVAEWDRALNEGDVDGALALYASDPVALPPDQPPAIGREAVRGVLEGIVSQPGLELRNTMEDFRIDGDLAAVRGSYTLSTTPQGGETASGSGKWVGIATRGTDGTWKIATNIWNMDAPAGE